MMLTQLSARKKSAIFNMLLFTLNKNKALIIFGSILSFLVLPIFPVFSAVGYDESQSYMSEVTLATLFGCWFIASGITLLLTAINFSFMHLKSSSDLFFSIPMTRRGVFVSRLLASFIGGTIPMIIPSISAAVICSSSQREDYALGCLWIFVITALTNLMFAVIGSFFMLFAGRTFEAVASLLIFNIGLPILAVIVVEQMTENLYGMPYTAFSEEFYFAFSPLLTGGYLIYSVVDSLISEYAFSFPVSSLIWIVLSALILIICIIFVRKRKCESASSAFAHKSMPILITALSSVIVAFLFGIIFAGGAEFSFTFVIFAIIGGLLAAAVLGAIFNRNFKNITKNLWIGGISAALYSAFIIIIVTGGFGYVTRVPNISNIESATYLVGGSKYNINTDIASTTLTEREGIEALLEVNKNVVDNRVINKNEGSNTFYVTYKLKNGGLFERRYEVSRSYANNEFAILDKMQQKMNNVGFDFGSEEKVRMDVTDNDKYSDKYAKFIITREDAKSLVNSYIEEHKTTTEEYSEKRIYLYNIIIEDEGAELLKLESGGGYYETVLSLSEDYTKTLALLEHIKERSANITPEE